jgi:plasmid stability protein
MTNLTISIDEDIVRMARMRAWSEGTSVSAKVRKFLTDYAKAEGQAAPPKPVDLPVFRGGGGLLPDIDPCSNKSMHDAADGFLLASPLQTHQASASCQGLKLPKIKEALQ